MCNHTEEAAVLDSSSEGGRREVKGEWTLETRGLDHWEGSSKKNKVWHNKDSCHQNNSTYIDKRVINSHTAPVSSTAPRCTSPCQVYGEVT